MYVRALRVVGVYDMFQIIDNFNLDWPSLRVDDGFLLRHYTLQTALKILLLTDGLNAIYWFP